MKAERVDEEEHERGWYTNERIIAAGKAMDKQITESLISKITNMTPESDAGFISVGAVIAIIRQHEADHIAGGGKMVSDTLNLVADAIEKAFEGMGFEKDPKHDALWHKGVTLEIAKAALSVIPQPSEISETALNDLADQIILACLTGVSKGDLKKDLIKWLRPYLREPKREIGKQE